MARMTYFERPATIAVIFGSFFVVFLPLWLLQWQPNFVELLPYFAMAHAVGLGTTHFFVTLALYVSRENRAYFASSLRNRLVYFAVPAALFAFFAWAEGSGLRASQPVLAGYLFGVLRFADFFHVGRQSVGMQQLWKRPLRTSLPAWSRHAENAFFVGMAAMQWLTFRRGGQFASDELSSIVPAAALFLLFAIIALSYVRAVERLGDAAGRAPWIALAYFAMQGLSAAVAVYDTRLYLAALTLHYVEYHVIMAPRCFREPRPRARQEHADRPAALLRAHPIAFYVILLAVVLVFELRNHVPGSIAPSTRYFVHLFDGIFFVHYFVEAFLWKFGTPFYRERLAPLYFEPAQAAAAAPSTRSHADDVAARTWVGAIAGSAALAAVLGVVHALGGAERVAENIERRVIAPMQAENHLRWGALLLRDGELGAARTHLQRALRAAPNSPNAEQLLRVADRVQAQAGGGLERR
jgi:hypothetical protein